MWGCQPEGQQGEAGPLLTAIFEPCEIMEVGLQKKRRKEKRKKERKVFQIWGPVPFQCHIRLLLPSHSQQSLAMRGGGMRKWGVSDTGLKDI